jgi:uncharacterized protein YciI
MKNSLALFILFITVIASAQSGLPDYLQGTWKMENKEIYEHWDKPNESALKGFSYSLKDGKMTVSEYLEITEINKEINYKATVLKQNQGKEVKFKLTKKDSTYTFENPDHDFPKKIVYQKLNDKEIFVRVSDGRQKEFAYKMQKQYQKNTTKDTAVSNPNYDPVLAQKLGGDDYGMKSYVLVILKTGTNQTTDKDLINNSFRGHMENINHLVKEGKMLVAGPLGKNDKAYRGIFILNVTTFEEAESLLQNDNAIKEGILGFELYKWYGSAALPEYLDFSDKIWKQKP